MASQNEKLYPFLVEAADRGLLTWTFSTDEETNRIFNRAVNLNFLMKDPKHIGTLLLTEKGQKVVDANGDFSVVEEQPTSIHAPNSNIHFGDNSGTYHQESDNSNNKNTNRKTIKNTVIAIFIATVAGLIVWYLTT